MAKQGHRTVRLDEGLATVAYLDDDLAEAVKQLDDLVTKLEAELA